MKAMILAAGFGTRLRPLTDSTPKCLIEVCGKPMLEHLLARLVNFAADGIVVNTHYLPEQVDTFLASYSSPVRIDISHEEEILGTGGALRKASQFLAGSDPYLLHNADVYLEFDFSRAIKAHLNTKSIATLLVSDRVNDRPLLTDDRGNVLGLIKKNQEEVWFVPPEKQALRKAYQGVSLLSPRLEQYFPSEISFGLFDAISRAVQAGEQVTTYSVTDYPWFDIGTVESLGELESFLKQKA